MSTRVFLPFDLPVYRELNSNHPLLSALVEQQYDGIEFVRADQVPELPAAEVLRYAAALAEQVTAASPELAIRHPKLLLDLILSRGLDSQGRIPVGDLSFFHTAPVHLGQMDWVLHIESISQIFAPCLRQGVRPPGPIRELPIFHLVRCLLESPRCRGIFTNLEFTRQQMTQVFNSPIITGKVRHTPNGPYFTDRQLRIIEAARERRRVRQEVKVLFTNSWHDDASSFLLRGGLEVLCGFLSVADACPNLHLVMRTSLPEGLAGTALGAQLRQHPRIQLCSGRLTDDEMVALFADADIFWLDACGLHSVSLLRAMLCESACVVSDAPGYEEYVDDGLTGVVLPGRRAIINHTDEESGWIFDDYTPLWSNPVNQPRCVAAAQTLQHLYHEPQLRWTLARRAREQTLGRNSFGPWRDCFESVLRSALAETGRTGSRAVSGASPGSLGTEPGLWSLLMEGRI